MADCKGFQAGEVMKNQGAIDPRRHSSLFRTALVTVVAATSFLVPLIITGATVAGATGGIANCTVSFTNNTSPAPISATGTSYISDSGQTYSGDVGAAFVCTGLPTGDDYDVITATQSVGGNDNSFQFPMYWDQACNGSVNGTFPTNWSATLPIGYGPGADLSNTYTGGSGCVYIQPWEHWLASLGSVTYAGDTYPFPTSILVSTDGGETRTLISSIINGVETIQTLSGLGLATGDAARSGPCANGHYPVNCASGDFWHTFTDASIPGYGPGLDLTRTYNSLNASAEGIFGYGWTTSYESHLTVNGDGSITITEADGSQVTAEPNGSGGFNVPDWADSALTTSGGSYTFVRQGTETYLFNSSGILTALTDANGYSTTLTYSSGKLTTVTDAAGQTLTLAYGSNGLVSSVTDPMSRATTYAYDSSGDLTSVTDPLSRVTSFTYNTTSHLLLTMTFPNGQSGGPDAGDKVTNTYNSSDQVVTQTDQMGNETTYSYTGNNFSSTGGTTTITDPDGNVEVQDYTYGMLQSLTKGYGTGSAATWSYEYDPTTLGLTQTTDPNGNVTSSTYDSYGNVLTTTNGLGKTSSYSYNSFNEQTCATEPLAANPCSSLSPPTAITAGTASVTPPSSAPPKYVTYREYDTNGNLIYTTTGDYAPGSGTASQSHTTYDLYNGESVTLNSVTESCTSTAPSTELPCATINADGVVTQLAYNSYGDLTSTSTPDQNILSSPGTISTFAGGPMGSVTANDLAQQDVQVATATISGTSYAYVADAANNVIRRVNLSSDAETVVAGNYAYGYFGDSGIATGAQLGYPEGVAVDSSGDFAIADTGNNVVRFVPASSGAYFGHSMTAGDIYTIAGNGTSGYSGNNGAATSAELSGPESVTLSSSGVAIADTGNNVIRFVPLTSGTYFGVSMTAGDIYLVAGNHTAGYSGNGGAATSAELSAPDEVAVDGSGDLAIADAGNNVIRFATSTTTTHFGQSMTANDIYTVAGNHTAGYSGFGVLATTAELSSPEGVAFDSAGDVMIADTGNFLARFIPVSAGTHFGVSMSANDIYTVAGYNSYGFSGNGGAATSAQMAVPDGIAMDASGDLVISDNYNDDLRIVAASSGTLAGQSVTAGDIYNLAGTGHFSEATNSGAPSAEDFYGPGTVRTDAAGDVLIADTDDNAVRFVPATSGTYFGVSMTAHTLYTIAGTGWQAYSGNGGPATSAHLDQPDGVAIDSAGDVAIADTQNNVIRFVPKTSGTYFGVSMTAGDIYAVAGNATWGYSGNGGAATSAELEVPGNVAFDASGDLVITDTGNNVIRFVPKTSGTYYGQSMTADDIYPIAGNATAGYSGNGGAATSAKLDGPYDATADAAGDLLIADASNDVVRFVPASSGTHFGQSMTADDIYTIAGNGTFGNSGVGGIATSAELGTVVDAAFDASGDILIVDNGNDLLQFVPKSTAEFYGASMTANDLYTIAGAGWGSSHFSGDGGPPLSAEFSYLWSVAPDSTGGYYLSDAGEGRVRYVAVNDLSTFNVTTSYAYNADGEVTSVTTPNGNLSGANAANFTTAFTLDADGEVTAATQGGGTGATVTARTKDYGYDGDGNLTSQTDPRGYSTDYANNADDEETLTTNSLSNVSLTCYDGDGNVAETVPALGVAANSLTASSCPTSYPTDYGDRLATDATTYAYNALGEQTTMTTPAPAGLTGHETTTYAYDLGGRLTSVTAPHTSTSGGAANDVTSYTYDAAGDLLTTTTGYGTATAATTSKCYDPNGDVTATIAADGDVSSVATCSTSSPYETSSAYQTGYSYDSLGELVTQTAPDTTAAPSGQVTSYAYDPLGNVLTEENPDGATATDTLTPLNQLASVTYSAGTHEATYTYDADGNQTGMFDASGISSSTFDPFDELTSTTNGAGQSTTYAYDLDGDVTGITYPLGSGATWASTDTVTYSYDHADQLASVTDFNGHTSNLTVNADGLPTAFTLGASGDTVSTSYAANDAPSSITLGNGSTLQEFAYSDAPSGGVLSETDTPSSALSPADYDYDAQSQVTSDTPGSGGAKSYVEDASGNLTTTPTGASGTYDDASELTSSVLSGTTTSYTYDASGNRVGASVGGTATVTASYNGAGELANYDNAAANMSSATYDGDGFRTSETTGSTTQHFVWNTVTAVPELLMDSTNAYIYGPSGTPFEQVALSGGTIHYLDSDVLGTVRGVVSSGGSLTASTSYDAWGNPETTGGLTAYTPIGFAGGYTDATNLIYFIYRYYDPATGTFVSVDPAVRITHQSYLYTGDNPVNSSDPLGQDTLGICAGAGEEFGPINATQGACLTRTIDKSGEDDIGLTFTAGAGGGVGEDASAGVYYQVSTATNLQQLKGPFFYATVGGQYGAGVTVTVFWNYNESVVGIEFGPSLGAGADAASGATYTDVDQFYGTISANIARGVWDVLNPGVDITKLLLKAQEVIDSLTTSCG
jgi:RHS repeat-associated protein